MSTRSWSESAFGIDHGQISKARRGPGVVRGRVDPNTSMTHRGGANYFQPSEQQVAASRARRAQQAEYKAGRPDRRVGGGKKVPWKVHHKAMGRIPKTVVPILAVGGGAGYLLHQRTKPDEQVAKMSPQKKEQTKDVALGATAGTAAGIGGVTLGGQAAKITLKNRRAKRGQSPREQKIWAQHVNTHGGRKGKGNNWKAYSKYPKELPDWRGQRLLAFKNRPAVSIGLGLAGTAAGAKYGFDRNRAKNKP